MQQSMSGVHLAHLMHPLLQWLHPEPLHLDLHFHLLSHPVLPAVHTNLLVLLPGMLSVLWV